MIQVGEIWEEVWIWRSYGEERLWRPDGLRLLVEGKGKGIGVESATGTKGRGGGGGGGGGGGRTRRKEEGLGRGWVRLNGVQDKCLCNAVKNIA